MGLDQEQEWCLNDNHKIKNKCILRHDIDSEVLLIDPILEIYPSLIITSGYRCAELNKILGGSNTSQHIFGQAVDLKVPQLTTADLYNWIYSNIKSYDQLIWEYPERGDYTSNGIDFSWVHISWVSNNNPRTTSLSTTREDVHEMYKAEKTTRIGNYTHRIAFADQNLF